MIDVAMGIEKPLRPFAILPPPPPPVARYPSARSLWRAAEVEEVGNAPGDARIGSIVGN